MARNEKGGVHTQKVTSTLVVFLLLSGAVIGGACLMMSGDVSDGANNIEVDKDYAQVGKTITATLEGDENYEFEADLRNDSGTSVGSVSPKTGSLNSDNKRELTVTMPSKSGDYKLFVTFKNSEGEVVKEFPGQVLKAVDPIVLKAKVTNVGQSNISFYAYFMVDGVKIDESEQRVSVEVGKTKEVTFDYIVRDTHEMKFTLESDDSMIRDKIVGLGEEHTAFTSKTDFTPFVIIAIIVLVALVVVMIWIIRKPVVNTGKPKARR